MIDESLTDLSFTEPLDEESFDELVKRTLDMDIDYENYNTGSIITGMLLRTALNTASLITNYQPYQQIINQENTDPTRILVTEDYIVHNHDIITHNDATVIPYRDFYKITQEYDIVYRNLLSLKYKNDSFNVFIIPYNNDTKIFEKSYDKNNIAIYFVPTTIKRIAGKASNNGKDILKIYSEKLCDYGYRIIGNRVEGFEHKVTRNDMESIIKSLRIINNALHK
mgnify:CR=1 FL=1